MASLVQSIASSYRGAKKTRQLVPEVHVRMFNMSLLIFNWLLLVALSEEVTIFSKFSTSSRITTKEDKENGRRREGYGDP